HTPSTEPTIADAVALVRGFHAADSHRRALTRQAVAAMPETERAALVGPLLAVAALILDAEPGRAEIVLDAAAAPHLATGGGAA
ncbi:hypothetical protein ACFP5Z_18565, partial [Kocuria oceani]